MCAHPPPTRFAPPFESVSAMRTDACHRRIVCTLPHRRHAWQRRRIRPHVTRGQNPRRARHSVGAPTRPLAPGSALETCARRFQGALRFVDAMDSAARGPQLERRDSYLLARGCLPLLGKEGVDGSSPSEGLQNPRSREFSFRWSCFRANVQWVWSVVWSFEFEKTTSSSPSSTSRMSRRCVSRTCARRPLVVRKPCRERGEHVVLNRWNVAQCAAAAELVIGHAADLDAVPAPL